MSETDKVVEVRGDYLILEREILGSKYYCLARVYNIFGFKFTRKMKTMCGWNEDGSRGVRTWQGNKYFIQDVINSIERNRESKALEKLLK